VDAEQIESWDASYDSAQSTHRTADGVDLYYEQRGQGPHLTILSSVFVVSTAWRNFTERLVGDNTVLTYDIRNQGASSMGDGAYENHLNDLSSLLDGLGIETTYLLAVSFSTLFARDYALANPDRVKGLLLCGPAISPYNSIRRSLHLKAWLAALEANGPAGLFDASYPFVLGDHTISRGGSAAYLALRDRFLAVHSKGQLRANLEGGLDASDSKEKLRGLKCPVLLFTGDDDFNVSRSGLEDQAALIPDARVEIIPRCGHAAYVEQTEIFEGLVDEFISEVEARETTSASAGVGG
jgi:pimeloyl-ACP methyl ester carboxylesterase